MWVLSLVLHINLLRQFFSDDDVSIILKGSTHDVSMLLKGFVRREIAVPPISDLISIIAMASFSPPRFRDKFIDDAIKSYGLLTRVWSEPSRYKQLKQKALDKLKNVISADVQRFVGLYLFTISMYKDSPVDVLINVSALIDFFLLDNDFYPSERILDIVDSFREVSNLDVILDELKETLIHKLPKTILADLNFYSQLLLCTDLSDIKIKHLVELFGSSSMHLYKYLLALTLGIIIAFERPIEHSIILTRFMHILFESLPMYSGSPYLLFIATKELCSLSRSQFALLLNSYFLAKKHKDGHILETILGKMFSSLSTPQKILLLIETISTPYLNRLLLYTSRISRYTLREINTQLLNSGLKPHSLALVIPWELLGSLSYLLDSARNLLAEYKTYGVRPPKRLISLYKFLRNAYKLKQKQNKADITTLIKYLSTMFQALAYGSEFTSQLKQFYGIIPGFYKIINDINKSYNRFSRKWSYTLLTSYNNLIKERPDLFTYSALNNIEQTNNLIIVIDGLRYDDFITRLTPKLRSIGIKPIRIKPKISLLPSITSISRYAIIAGKPLEVFNVTRRTPREDELLIKRFENVDIFYGPLGLIQNNISSKSKLSKNVVIVLSELEKSMHGASEAVLAHFIEEYLNSVIELISYTTSRMREQSKEKIHITICSDHGLGTYHKYYELDDFIERLSFKRLLDNNLDPTIRERYAAIPAKNPQAILSIRSIYTAEEEFLENFFLIRADELNYRFVEFFKRSTKALTDLKPANEVLFLFPKGPIKFIRTRGSIFHGGLSPEETFSAFGVFLSDGNET